MEPILFRTSPYVYSRKTKDVDFQSKMFNLGVAPDVKNVVNCIIVATSSDDSEISHLSLYLAKYGIRMLRFDSDITDNKISTILNGIIYTKQGEKLRPLLFWRRHFTCVDYLSSSGMVKDRDVYIGSQSDALMEYISEVSSISINAKSVCRSRMRQVEIASCVGMCTVQSVVVTNLLEAINIFGDGIKKYIVKPIGSHWIHWPPCSLKGIFPKIVLRDEIINAEEEPVPVMVQPFIEHAYEIRVYLIGTDIIGYSVTGKSNADSLWDCGENLKIAPIDVGIELRKLIYDFQRKASIEFGAFDFLVTEEGDHIFLEVNLLGDWKYFEKSANDHRVTCAVTKYILERFRSEDSCI
ncbi:hypothetical protein [Arcanobacterium hippocoleae]|uniref:ATP-grasp domain-containing protein n=1 Tax=Arcanobacterium hippocoleae TaxID=149017 RepID=A0ABU1T2Q7_9ACTO|nr:hypothetical protein [Arcanobacterium hippocoleae]MDR6939530.1 hypothetical protein [Arcanobacterium hippocoleae]